MDAGKVALGAVAFGLGALLVWLVERKPEVETVGPLPACELVPGTVVNVVSQPLPAQTIGPLPAQIINP